MVMNQEVKVKWVAGLRSGEYKQGKDALKKGDLFCCLGVLCDIYMKETGNGEWIQVKPKLEGLRYKFIDNEESSSVFLINSIKYWAGLDCCIPVVKSCSLSSMNDRGETFLEIADLIDQEL